MARLRFMAVALLALALAGNSTQTGRTQTDRSPVSCNHPNCVPMSAAVNDRSCVIYSLTDMGYDADLGKWVAQTIPEMIEPNSWKESGGAGALRYYAPKNILIVNHSAAVQAKVDDFLRKLKTSLPKTSRTGFATSKKSNWNKVAPAEYHVPAPMRTANPLPEPSSYPVPAPVKPPKHLFHFLIRYEGEGIIDDNVVKFMKNVAPAMKDGNCQTPGQTTAQGYSDSPPASSSLPMCAPAPSTSSAPSAGWTSPGPVASVPAGTSLPQPKKTEEKKDDQKEKSDKESP
jgi:hypothetical protein